MIIVLIILFGIAVSGLFSLPARIPVLRRHARQSRQFRYGLMIVLGGLMFVTVIVFLAGLLFSVSIGVSVFYNNLAPEPFLTDEVVDSYHKAYGQIWLETTLRLLIPFAHHHCFQVTSSYDVCSIVDTYSSGSAFIQFIVWLISLCFGYITGAFTAYHTRDNRKQKRS